MGRTFRKRLFILLAPLDPAALATLASQIQALEAQTVVLGSWLHLWSWVVVVGIISEIGGIVWIFVDDWKLWKRKEILPAEKPKVALLVFEIVATLIVAGGVAGELLVGIQLENANSDIRRKEANRLEIVRQTAIAADAKALSAAEKTKREIDARLALEKKVLWYGPRYEVIHFHGAEFKRRLGGYRGQKFRISTCDPSPFALPQPYGELSMTGIAIRSVLTDAGWTNDDWPANAPNKPREPMLMLMACNDQPGVYTGLNSAATKPILEAEQSLQRVLNDVLQQSLQSPGPFFTIGSDPTTMHSREPLRMDEIDVEVDIHPAVTGDPRRTSP